MNVALPVIVLSFLLLLPSKTKADMPDPSFYAKRCNPGEEMVTCDYSFERFGGDYEEDECALYRDNPNYRFLGGTGGSLGGTSRYCLRIGAESVETTRREVIVFGISGLVLAAGSFLLLGKMRKHNMDQGNLNK